ncbi:MAG TPA: polyribonucleotide nucleotidyltransferase [Candidatus Azoamicus sp.]
MYINKEIKIFDKILKIKSGWFAKNAESSILAEVDGTVLLVTVVYSFCTSLDFLPLKVEYFERFYAGGRIPFNYLKREGKPSEREILIARLIDRSVRPMFSKDLNIDIQITVTVISVNHNVNPDIVALNAVSIALYLSDLPFNPILSFRVLYKNGLMSFNTLSDEIKDCDLDMVISGSNDKICMIEGFFNEIESSVLLSCLKESYFYINKFLPLFFSLKKYKRTCNLFSNNKISILFSLLVSKYYDVLFNLYIVNEYDDLIILQFKKKIYFIFSAYLNTEYYKSNFLFILDLFFKYVFRKKILFTKVRLDFRQSHDIRNIYIESTFLNRIHGSSIFSRGGTQSFVSVTLGSYKDAQLVDCVFFSHYKNNFILHYNFPPYAVNEIGNFSSVKRREIGHGNLAKKSLVPVLPKFDDFPYVIRLVSEILGSNGSSSMATVCGASLALMNAGVPIKNHVAGIAMGLIKEQNDYVILSDISGSEDFIGDMDFKITSTKIGLTSVQMDLKIDGIDINVISEILSQAKRGLDFILNTMYKHISEPSKNLSSSLPKVKNFKVDKSKIGIIIGKSGSVIKTLIEKYKCDIDISDDGMVRLSSDSIENINLLFEEINSLIFEFKVGMTFDAKVNKITQFGAFINLLYKKSGLLHISKINKYRLSNPSFILEEESKIKVKILSVDLDGKINLDLL